MITANSFSIIFPLHLVRGRGRDPRSMGSGSVFHIFLMVAFWLFCVEAPNSVCLCRWWSLALLPPRRVVADSRIYSCATMYNIDMPYCDNSCSTAHVCLTARAYHGQDLDSSIIFSKS